MGNETPVHGGETNGTVSRSQEREMLPPPPPLPPRFSDLREAAMPTQAEPSIPPPPREDIFEGVGSDYVPTVHEADSPKSEDMEESPGRDNERVSYFTEHYGPVPPSQDVGQGWQPQVCCYILDPLIL